MLSRKVINRYTFAFVLCAISREKNYDCESSVLKATTKQQHDIIHVVRMLFISTCRLPIWETNDGIVEFNIACLVKMQTP